MLLQMEGHRCRPISKSTKCKFPNSGIHMAINRHGRRRFNLSVMRRKQFGNAISVAPCYACTTGSNIDAYWKRLNTPRRLQTAKEATSFLVTVLLLQVSKVRNYFVHLLIAVVRIFGHHLFEHLLDPRWKVRICLRK